VTGRARAAGTWPTETETETGGSGTVELVGVRALGSSTYDLATMSPRNGTTATETTEAGGPTTVSASSHYDRASMVTTENGVPLTSPWIHAPAAAGVGSPVSSAAARTYSLGPQSSCESSRGSPSSSSERPPLVSPSSAAARTYTLGTLSSPASRLPSAVQSPRAGSGSAASGRVSSHSGRVLAVPGTKDAPRGIRLHDDDPTVKISWIGSDSGISDHARPRSAAAATSPSSPLHVLSLGAPAATSIKAERREEGEGDATMAAAALEGVPVEEEESEEEEEEDHVAAAADGADRGTEPRIPPDEARLKQSTLDRVKLSAARREAEAEDRRRQLAEEYRAVEAQRKRQRDEEIQQILAEERRRKEEEDALKYAGIEEAQQRLSELAFSFTFDAGNMGETPTETDAETATATQGASASPTQGQDQRAKRASTDEGARRPASPRSSLYSPRRASSGSPRAPSTQSIVSFKQSPNRSSARRSSKRFSAKKSYSPRAVQQTQNNRISAIETELDVTGLAAQVVSGVVSPPTVEDPKPSGSQLRREYTRGDPGVTVAAVQYTQPRGDDHDTAIPSDTGTGSHQPPPRVPLSPGPPQTARRVSVAGGTLKRKQQPPQASPQATCGGESNDENAENTGAVPSLYNPVKLEVRKLDRTLFETFDSAPPPERQPRPEVCTNLGPWGQGARVGVGKRGTAPKRS